MKTNSVVWFEIYVAEMVRARKFYEAVLGVTLEPAEKWRVTGQRCGCFQAKTTPVAPAEP